MTTERMAPLSKRGVQQWAEPLLLSACAQCSLLRAHFPGFCSNLFTDSPWLPPGCSNSHVLLSNKGTWNQKNWVRPNGQSGVGPVKAVFTGLSAATGPSAPSSPSLTQSIMEASPRAARQPHWAGSLRPQHVRSTGPCSLTLKFSLLVKPLPPLPPLSLVLHSHFSPLASESIL